MKHPLSTAILLALGLLTAACDTTAPAASRSQSAEAELSAYFGGPGGGTSSTSGSDGHFTGVPAKAGGGDTGSAIAPPVQNDPTMDWADPCAQNLDELVSALLVYYGQHNALPPTLEQIPKTSPTGAPISISCPDSGKRYIYFPKGLRAPGEFTYQRADGSYQEGSRLLLYDAEPVHQAGQRGAEGGGVKRTVRLGIVMELPLPTPTVPNPAVQMYIVPLEQGIVDMYLKTNHQ